MIPIFNSYHHKGFDVIGISLDTDANAWKKAILVDGYPWTNLSDLKGFESVISRRSMGSLKFPELPDRFQWKYRCERFTWKSVGGKIGRAIGELASKLIQFK